MNEVEKIKKVTSKVHGWLHNAEGKLLYKLAKKLPKNSVIVEIGSWHGKSTIWLASGAKMNNSRVYAIDPHNGNSSEIKEEFGEIDTFNIFINNLKNADLLETVEPIKKRSIDASNDFSKSIDLLFIDGDHDYEAVKNDFDHWFPKLKKGGIIVFHDTVGKFHGPRKFVYNKIFNGDLFKNVRFVNTITYGTKLSGNSILQKIQNKVYLIQHKILHFLVSIYLILKK